MSGTFRGTTSLRAASIYELDTVMGDSWADLLDPLGVDCETVWGFSQPVTSKANNRTWINTALFRYVFLLVLMLNPLKAVLDFLTVLNDIMIYKSVILKPS
jgi:hypothetical protein